MVLSFMFRPPLLAQEVPSANVINYLVDNTKNLSLDFDTNNPEQPGNLVKPNEKPFDLGELGTIVFSGETQANLPNKLSIIGNTASAGVGFKVQHLLDGVDIPEHIRVSLLAETSDSGLLTPEGKIGSVKLSFSGLLLKGVPEYLSKSDWMKELKKQGFTLDIEGDNKATLSRVISVKPEHLSILQEYQKTENGLQRLRDTLDQGGTFELASPELKEKVRRAMAAKSILLNELFGNLEFSCGPEFSREFKFPIVERSASGSAGSASGRAAVGISGDVAIEIKNPTCGVSLAPPFKLETWTYADMDITSRGFLGARAEGQGSTDFGVSFTDKYGSYPVSTQVTDEEKQMFSQIVLKTLDKAKNSEKMIQSVQQDVESKLSEIHNSITTALIGDGTDKARICSLFDQLGLKTSEINSACNAVAVNPEVPSIPQPDLPPAPNLPPRPRGECKAQLPMPPCSIRRERICGVCEKCVGRGRFRVCSPIPCTNCSTKDIEVPLGCGAARRSVEAANATSRTVCDKLKAWENEVAQINANWEAQKRELQANWERASEAARQQANAARNQADPGVLLSLARQTIQDKVLRQVDTKAVAKKMLDAAWQLSDVVDYTQDFISDNVPQSLALSIKGSSRASVTSRAHILHARPKFMASANLDVGQDGQPALNLSMSSIQNAREDGTGGIGGLDINGFTLTAEQVVTLGGNEIQRVNFKAEDFNPTFDEGKINLSNQKETIYEATYRYH